MTVTLPAPAAAAALSEPPRNTGLWRSLPPKAKAGTVLLGVFVLAGIIGPLVTPYDPSFQNPSPALSLQPPSAAQTKAMVAAVRRPRQRAVRPRGEHVCEHGWIGSIIWEMVPSPCIG